jgi:predicted PurR-regulated permease PerM
MPDTPHDASIARSVLVATAIFVAVTLLVVLIYFTIDVILLVFSAALIAIFLRGLAMPVGRYLKIGDVWSVLLVTLILVLVLAAGITLLAPSVNEQIQVLRVELPETARAAAEFLGRYTWGQTILNQLPGVDQIMGMIATGSLIAGVGGVFASTIGAVGNFFIVVLLAIYFASEPRLYSDGLAKLFPIRQRPRAQEVFAAIGQTLQWWLIGKVASMIFIGILTWIGLSIIGVPMALTLGLIAGLLSFIPNFGPIISAIPAVLFAFIVSPISALYAAGLFIGVQLVESNLVTPFIERRTVELPPALTVVFQLGLAVTIGGLGLVLATPLLAVVVVLVQMVYLEDILGDRTTAKEIGPDEPTSNADPQ